jgi:hypothetical protein
VESGLISGNIMMNQDNDLKARNIKTLVILVAVALSFYGVYILTTALGG